MPAGTRNHFALDLGLDRDDVVGALDAFLGGVERRVDLARVNGRVFVNNASMGLYAKIVQSDSYRDAKLKTAADMLPDFLGPDAAPFDLRFAGPGGTCTLRRTSSWSPTTPTSWTTSPAGGPVSVWTWGPSDFSPRIAGPKEALSFVALEAAGKVRKFPGWLEWESPSFRVASGEPVEIGVDGEALRLEPPLVFESLPGALRVRLPPHAPGLAVGSSTKRYGVSTVRALIRVAIGQQQT